MIYKTDYHQHKINLDNKYSNINKHKIKKYRNKKMINHKRMNNRHLIDLN
jgi:hypothetical protein